MKISAFVKPYNVNKRTYRVDYGQFIHDLTIDGDLYQFGVYSGMSMINILELYESINVEHGIFWGFDSFCGMPDEPNEPLMEAVWAKGEFSVCDYLDIDDVTIAKNIILSTVHKYYPNKDVRLIPGFFCDSLVYNPEMQPASFIDVDVDIYTSTMECMTFMFENKLIVPGTIINYDDWHGIGYGEGRAHVELQKKYGFKCKQLNQTEPLLFRIEEI